MERVAKVTVPFFRNNWCIVFRFAGAGATDVDLVDYH